MINSEAVSERSGFEFVAIVGGWTTAAAMTLLAYVYTNETKQPYLMWIWVTLAVAVALAAVSILVAVDVRLTQKSGSANLYHLDNAGGSVATFILLLGARVLCFFGGLLYFLWIDIAGIPTPIHCRFPGVDDEVHCLPIDLGETLSVISAVAAIPALLILLWAGRTSRVAAWLSPAIILGLYVLARMLWGPRY
ncbi:hypothetical protein ACFY4C_25000 [Actinomadura viridis]|uniref:hypothetical protein n=1 Tax=Actinomadura viridis TaxID=58110 RepID=UPI003675158B